MTGTRTRLLDALAGMLAAGLLVIGVVLLLAVLIAPTALPAVGLGPAAGPGWSSVLAHLAVGGAGELVVRLRGRWSTGVRAGADATVIAAVLAVLWWQWWP